MPQLDSLRAIAVVFVLIEHWLRDEAWTKHFSFGMSGVTLFFVLSGFLITRILLSNREMYESGKAERRHLIRQFYIRRTLRIFPIYYITLALLFVMNVQGTRESFLWFVTYTCNIHMYLTQSWIGNLSHFWTLAVEEQFYLVWPFLIMFVPRKFLFRSISLIIVLGPVSRAVLYIMSGYHDSTIDFIHILTPTCMDCFGIGAIFAYSEMFCRKPVVSNRQAVIGGGIVFLFVILMNLMPSDNILTVFFYRLCISVLSMLIIYKASTGFSGVTGRILDNSQLRYLGKISYGMYLFHYFVSQGFKSFGINFTEKPYLGFAACFAVLVAVSSASWYFIENPINNLKRKFEYN